MNTKLKDPLVWIDCEMTGLNVDKDALIEVAVVITDGNLEIIDRGIDVLIAPGDEALAGMDDFVRNMHTQSGLLSELQTQTPTMAEAEEQVLDYIKRFVPTPGKALLAGNSVGTDRVFLEKNMPGVIDYLHYRIIDVSTVKELAKRWFPRVYLASPEKCGGHRALADILESIQELVYYRRALWPTGSGPSTKEAQDIARDVQKQCHSDLEKLESNPQ